MRARSVTHPDAATSWHGAGRRVALAIGIAVLCGLMQRPTMAQEFLACGVPTTHHLQSGNTDQFVPEASNDLPLIADVADTSGTIGLIQLTPETYCGVCPFCPPCPSTCNGSIAFPASPTPLAVSDCVGSNTGDYTIEFNVVAQSPENCGRPLSCGVEPNDTALNVPGEVDAYTFAGIGGQQISLTTAAASDTTGSLRMRLFSPKGDLQSDSCSGTLTYDVPSTGTYTVLVSACVVPSTGPYTIVYQTLPACPTPLAPAVAYVTYARSGTVGVIDLATNQTVSLVPVRQPQRESNDFAAISTSPNSGFAYVTFAEEGTISIINTTLNRVVGSINVPVQGGNLRIGLDPQGRYLYAPSNALNGLLVVDTATRKSQAFIPIGDNDYFLTPTIRVSPDGKFVYISTFTAAQKTSVIVVDTASKTVVGRVTDQRFTSDPLDISFNSSGTVAYLTFPDGLYIVDTATRSVTKNLPLQVSAIAFSRDGRTAYAPGAGPPGSSAVLVIDMATLTVTSPVLFGFYSQAVALSPDGTRLLVINAETQGIFPQDPVGLVVDTATLQVVATIPTAGDKAVGVAIVTPPSGLCTGDDRGQTRVTVGELVSSVDYSVDGCPTARNSRPAAP